MDGLLPHPSSSPSTEGVGKNHVPSLIMESTMPGSLGHSSFTDDIIKAVYGAGQIKSVTVSTVSPSICHEVMGPDAMI